MLIPDFYFDLGLNLELELDITGYLESLTMKITIRFHATHL